MEKTVTLLYTVKENLYCLVENLKSIKLQNYNI